MLRNLKNVLPPAAPIGRAPPSPAPRPHPDPREPRAGRRYPGTAQHSNERLECFGRRARGLPELFSLSTPLRQPSRLRRRRAEGPWCGLAPRGRADQLTPLFVMRLLPKSKRSCRTGFSFRRQARPRWADNRACAANSKNATGTPSRPRRANARRLPRPTRPSATLSRRIKQDAIRRGFDELLVQLKERLEGNGCRRVLRRRRGPRRAKYIVGLAREARAHAEWSRANRLATEEIAPQPGAGRGRMRGGRKTDLGEYNRANCAASGPSHHHHAGDPSFQGRQSAHSSTRN